MELSSLKAWYSAYPDQSSEWWAASGRRLADVVAVLDDDPLGGQAVSDVPVYFSWDRETVEGILDRGTDSFFILTSSRSLSSDMAAKVCYEAVRNIAAACRERGKSLQIVCRSDSTLRIHYPEETDAIAVALADEGMPADGEIIVPFFEEGRRYTFWGVQYGLSPDGMMLPVSEMEYSKDMTFGFTASSIPGWVEEKSGGRVPSHSVRSILLGQLRADYRNAVREFGRGDGFRVCTADSIEYRDIFSVIRAVSELRANGQNYIIRCASSGVRAALFNRNDGKSLPSAMLSPDKGRILIAAGSHMKRTTAQLEYLLSHAENVSEVVFDQHTVLDAGTLEAETSRAEEEIRKAVSKGRDIVLVTRRERLDLPNASPEDQLRLTVQISHAFISLISRVSSLFSGVIAKGGNTASDIVRICFGADSASVSGQILDGVPVWKLPGGCSVVIFPGNVGEEGDLFRAYSRFRGF